MSVTFCNYFLTITFSSIFYHKSVSFCGLNFHRFKMSDTRRMRLLCLPKLNECRAKQRPKRQQKKQTVSSVVVIPKPRPRDVGQGHEHVSHPRDRTVDVPSPLCRSTGSFQCGYCGKCFRFYSEMLLHASLNHSRYVVGREASIARTEQSWAENMLETWRLRRNITAPKYWSLKAC